MENVNECKQGGVGIPKIIHYCWFGGGKKLPLMKHCLKSWRKVMPDYEIKCWDASTLDMTIPFIREAYKRKKWAFLTDYMRFYILWKEGGIFVSSLLFPYRSYNFHYECVNISSYQRFIYRIVDYIDRKIVGIINIFN